MMSNELQKSLPPRREVHHKIDLQVGAQQTAHAPCRLFPHEFKDLRKNLKESIEVSNICPLKELYDTRLQFKMKKDVSF